MAVGGGFGCEELWLVEHVIVYVRARETHALIYLSLWKNSHVYMSPSNKYHTVFCAHEGEAERIWSSMVGLPPRTLFPFDFLFFFLIIFQFLQGGKAALLHSRNISMASLRLMGLANLLLLLNPVTAVMEYGYIGPTPTSFGLVGIQSMAPRPTRPPNMDENNGELRKRRLPDSIYSRIPKSWCAFVNGDTGEYEAHSLVL